MRRNLSRALSCAAIAACAVLAARPATAQTVTLRYHPPVGTRFATFTTADFLQTFVGFESIPDSETAAVNSRVGLTQRVLGHDAGGYRVSLVLDSVRRQMRLGSTAPREMPSDLLVGRTVNLMVDSLFHATAVADTTDPSGAAGRQTAQAFYQMFALPLPPEAVSGGTSWNADVPFGLGDFNVSSATGPGTMPQQVINHLRMRVDSVVPRGSDTLAYVTAGGGFDPLTQVVKDSTDTATVTVRGGMGASQIWSTAWNGWVSGVVRWRIELKVQSAGKPKESSALIDLNGRMQVRP